MNKKELTKRLGSFLLSGVLIVSSAVPVMAKTQENTASMSTATFISSEASLNAESLNSSINGESISEGSLSAEESELLDAEHGLKFTLTVFLMYVILKSHGNLCFMTHI